MTLLSTNAILHSSSVRLSNYDGPVTSGLKHMAELNSGPHNSLQPFQINPVPSPLFNEFTVKHIHTVCVVNPRRNSNHRHLPHTTAHSCNNCTNSHTASFTIFTKNHHPGFTESCMRNCTPLGNNVTATQQIQSFITHQSSAHVHLLLVLAMTHSQMLIL